MTQADLDKAREQYQAATEKYSSKEPSLEQQGVLGSLPEAHVESPVKLLSEMKGKDLGRIYCVAWSADSELVVAAHQHGAVTVKTAKNGGLKNLPLIFPNKEEKIVPMACMFFNNDSMIAVGGMNNVVTLYDRSETKIQKGKELVGHEGYISSVKMLGDKILSGSGDSSIRLWDPSKGEEVTKMEGAHEQDVTAVDVMQSDPHMFVSSSTDASIKVWDARIPAARAMTRYFKAKHGVNACALFPTGHMVAGVCDFASFEFWDMRSSSRYWRGKVRATTELLVCELCEL